MVPLQGLLVDRFGQEVGGLFRSVNVVDGDLPSSHVIMEMVQTNFQVLGSRPVLVGAGNFQSTSVVFKYTAVIFGFAESTLKPLRFISLWSSIIGIASLRVYDRLVYSLSVLESAISVCIWDFQMMGHPWYDTMYPCWDLAVSRSHASFLSQVLDLCVQLTRTKWFLRQTMNITEMDFVYYCTS